MDPRDLRRLRQHLHADALLDIDAVPLGTTTNLPPKRPETARTNPTPEARTNVVSARTKRHENEPKRPKTDENGPDLDENGSKRAKMDQNQKSAPELDSDGKLSVLNDLRSEVAACVRCALAAGRTQTVFGEGDPDADIMFIGEGPGQNEDEQGVPFVGRAGQLLEKQIVAMGLSRSEVYIANVVKCRPPGNRNPAADEVDACSGYLRRQIETIRPKAIVTLGGPAAKLILNTREGITRIRGTWHSYVDANPEVPVMPTFHPAYLLRSYTVDNRKKVWSDLCAVLERLGKTPPKP
ncbi:uracil-DNA glycosylase [Mucisphaera calidilacus]|uniref:Type-4 uracil-DNA glycosylase n=1 Tax=Mucisphaera calidilacus TaxID=2527982 RepID=A0A518BY93_9BACT|nr:uracil-DNA glycosylase [Mucisphaera calidilacus]QDU71949.1 Uracil DNA glycosylase superfamily protein [Mucisphaera calidilacus]